MKGWKGRLGKQNGERLVDGWVDQRTIDGRTDGLMNEWTDGRPADGRTGGRMDGPADEGRTGGWTDEGRTDGGRTDVKKGKPDFFLYEYLPFR